MPPKKEAPARRLSRDDPDQRAWNDAWTAAYDQNRGELERFGRELDEARRAGRRGKRPRKVKTPALEETPGFPDWNAQRPAHVRRELLGRYLHDRDSKLLHDCYRAKPTCRLDEIANGTFVHFGGELDAALATEDVTLCSCMAEEA